MIDNSAFGVYVHWPFCASKCPYCDFNSHVHRGAFDEDQYLSAYVKEIETTAARAPGRLVHSIFFGGGTPSLMSPKAVGTIIDTIAVNWQIADNAEITLEANPTSIEANRFRGYRAAGVNRVSIGVQSLRQAPLERLGRLHSVEEAKAAVKLAQSIFDRSSFDLIYARPTQTLAEWREELKEALELSAGHLSMYQLTIEQGTRYFDLHQAGKLTLPRDEVAADMYDVTQELTSLHGMPAYEVSNHALPGHESLHNLIYWRYSEYAGIGPGAHGRLLINNTRYATVAEKMPFKWSDRVAEQGDGLITNDALTSDEEGDEFLVMGLRLREGINPSRYQALSGKTLRAQQLARLTDMGFIETLENGFVRATEKGMPVLNALVTELAA